MMFDILARVSAEDVRQSDKCGFDDAVAFIQACLGVGPIFCAFPAGGATEWGGGGHRVPEREGGTHGTSLHAMDMVGGGGVEECRRHRRSVVVVGDNFLIGHVVDGKLRIFG